ncbi:hypothetical protein V6Z11_A07G114500 [Gossypium hirsutum]|uniref:Uncharacterized protein n=2 Tax=Gossypium TaxID=3633 RepID=A0A5D2PRH0_GOSTO|nr:hypothetical protein ES288_A07G116400v1 [Gossypium darwinii]TYI18758.1 hypothetical protein ES332_A07G115200v1 [Gossypium tomentosum]
MLSPLFLYFVSFAKSLKLCQCHICSSFHASKDLSQFHKLYFQGLSSPPMSWVPLFLKQFSLVQSIPLAIK